MLVDDGLEERTVAIGENLHVVCVTATVPTGGSLLQSGSIYCYDVEIPDETGPCPLNEYRGNVHFIQNAGGEARPRREFLLATMVGSFRA